MQLFLIDPPQDQHYITLNDPALVHQMSRVLRMKPWSDCTLQWEEVLQTTRGLYTLDTISKQEINLELQADTTLDVRTEDLASCQQILLVVALPNKRAKAELIVQKLSEIGVSKIIWFPAERSQLRLIPEKKMQRMQEISKEATEQSWWWKKTKVIFVSNLEEVCIPMERVLICDLVQKSETKTQFFASDKERWKMNELHEVETKNDRQKNILTICIWPEGWRWPQDYESLASQDYSIIDLWERVLRMETAAIVAAWRGMNNDL